MSNLVDTPASFAGRIGVARRDITPPIGMYARMWGAARHDMAEGVHRPIELHALVVEDESGGATSGGPLVLISIDHCILGDDDPSPSIRRAVIDAAGTDSSRVMLACTHTHGVGFIANNRVELPGGGLIPPYIQRVGELAAEAVREARQRAVPAVLAWTTSLCNLAANRNLADPDKPRIVCGYNPDTPADDTLLVGRVTDDCDGSVMAVLINYACHPTTLAWENRLYSPDFVGALREGVMQHTSARACLFLQGASGELAPRWQYVGDPAVADRHGRQLGFATLAALESMLPPRRRLAYQGVMESGAPLALWRPQPYEPPASLEAGEFRVDLPLKPMPTPAELQRDLDACTDRTSTERLRRKLALVQRVGPGPTSAQPVWLWRLGDALLLGHANEAASDLQIVLRSRFPRRTLAVMNVVNGAVGYLNPPALYDRDIYQVWQSPFDRQALPTLIEACDAAIRRLHG